MKKTVFLKSTLRQFTRSLFLILLVGVISFAFVSRVGEVQLIDQEMSELIQYYRSIGNLVSARGDKAVSNEVVKYLEQAPHVAYTDRRKYTSGVIQDGYYNANGTDGSSSWMPNDVNNFPRILPWDCYFYAVYTGKEYDAPLETGLSSFPFTVDEVLAGYPEIIAPGMSVSLWVDWETFRGDCTKLERGGRYLLCATRRYTDLGSGQLSNRTDFAWLPSTPDWLLPAEENIDLSLPEYAKLAELIQETYDNAHALHVTATADMSAMPIVTPQPGNSVLYYLTEGRWLDHEDHLAGNRAIVIHKGLAEARGLALGDTMTLTLRDICYKNPEDGKSYSTYDGYLFDLPPAKLKYQTQTETFEIVGIYDQIFYQEGVSDGTTEYQQVFIPLSTLPNSFRLLPTEDHGPSYGLVLDSPLNEEAFLAATQEDLADMGYYITFLPTGYQNFKTATSGIQTAARSNVIIFAVILAVCFILACFVYFRFRQKDLAISRALGVPVGACVAGSVLPLVLMGGVGIVAGSALAWSYTQSNAETLLATLVEAAQAEGITATLPMNTLVILCLALIAALLVLALIFAVLAAQKPVLSQLQGGRNRK